MMKEVNGREGVEWDCMVILNRVLGSFGYRFCIIVCVVVLMVSVCGDGFVGVLIVNFLDIFYVGFDVKVFPMLDLF